MKESMGLRGVVVVLLLFASSMLPLASASEIAEYSSYGAPLSDNPEDAPITYSFSPAVRSAFARVSDLTQYSQSELEEVEEWVVVSSKPLGKSVNLLASTWIIELESSESIQQISELHAKGVIETGYPLVKRQMTPKWTPNDPYFSNQWHLENTGQDNGVSGEDVNITGAWNTAKGNGVVIGIVDDGLEWDHEDLSTNYESSLDYDYCNYDGDPMPNGWDAHGTAAAGVAAATGNNGIGVSGAAPDASLAGLMLIACSNSDNDEAGALSHLKDDIDIYSNSWGPSDDGETLQAPGPLMLAAFESDAYNGRNGLGNIITWAAGNGLDDDDDSNLDGYANSRFTISVTAVNHDGDQTTYGEPGANVLVSAPSDGSGVGITTTDLEGGNGYTNSDYTSNFGGTSSATPLVSGVIALMLETNSNLTWRDVQHIIVESSRKNDPNDSGWNTNGAGHEFNHKYGFGVIDAGHAVSLAENWNTAEPEVNITSGQITVSQSIPDDDPNNPIVSTHTVTEGLIVESVEILFDADHQYRSDLDVTLISPDGTESELVNYFAYRDSGNDYNEWMFSSVQHWGETSQGIWTLEVYDDGNQDVGTWNHWELIIHGTQVDLDSDDDGITDSNETDVYGTDPYNSDTDQDGLSDPVELFTTLTNATDSDTDDDLLNDGIEVNVNNTDPFDNDTDDDGLLDGEEVFQYHTNPLVPDPDADSDTYYWFQDCNDTNPNIHPNAPEILNGIDDDCDVFWDEGFNQTDVDIDNLTDYSEYHNYGTNWTNYDTDGDLLSDGDEILIYFTNPLVKDNDSDFDGWYWFEDCNDSNPGINPDVAEVLDGIDNNCRDGIDEDFIGLDSDSDGLLDLFEFNNLSTNPLDNDSDDDGLSDGEEYNNLSTNPLDADTDNDELDDGVEVTQTMTNPLVPDLDNDGDGFRWFLECDDTNSEINPNAVERWNGIDDNCDDVVDNDVNRIEYIVRNPIGENVAINATFEPLNLSIQIDLTQEEIDNLNFSIIWLRNNTEVSNTSYFYEDSWSCNNETSGLGSILCNHTGFIGPWIIHAIISDDQQDLYVTWYVTYEVWHPPVPVEEESIDDATEKFNLSTKEQIIAGVGLLVIILLITLFFQKKKPPISKQSVFVNPRYQPMDDQYSSVPSAPVLPPPPDAF
ncbi:MAG: S8 family serine peptidase [Candidatus Poseidoniaceae archaeon]|jgi:subtilisin-like proprotein convertase family protein|nr:S8 family serine peptidase [Candidatus Poseidoniaceae archaeon]